MELPAFGFGSRMAARDPGVRSWGEAEGSISGGTFRMTEVMETGSDLSVRAT